MTLSPQWLDELRSRITLSSIIGRTVRLQKAGREYKACCPFHNEKTPSFTINDEKGFYHCFGCGAHGDAIRWMTDNRGLPFIDAVKELAAEAGMDVPAADPRSQQKAKERATLHDAMAAAQDYFVDQLNGIEGARARDYLKGRGFQPEVVKAFGFGFAPDNFGRIAKALSDFDARMLIEAGLLISVENKEPYDRFRGRVMIPIRDVRGRVIAFGGRILGDGEPKYLNSPETPLFDKGRTLYNLDRALPASRQSGRMLVVEGYMDAIALAAVGVGDAVAPLGTALTEQQIEILWRSVERPILCFDGDAAGQKAAMRAAMRALPLLRPGHSLDFVTLPPGKDPDDIVRDEGRAGIERLISLKKPLVTKIWEHELAAEQLETPEQRAGLRQRLREHFKRIADRDVARHYADAFEEKLGELFVKRRAFSPSRSNAAAQRGGNGVRDTRRGARAFIPSTPHGDTQRVGSAGADDILVRAVVTGLIRYPDRLEAHFDQLSAFAPESDDLDRMLAALLDHAIGKESLDETKLMTILGDDYLYNCACGLLRADRSRFTFTRPRTAVPDDPGQILAVEVAERQARSDLDEAIRLMVSRPGLIDALKRATQAMELDLTDETFAEQQRLRQEMERFDNRLADLMQRDDENELG